MHADRFTEVDHFLVDSKSLTGPTEPIEEILWIRMCDLASAAIRIEMLVAGHVFALLACVNRRFGGKVEDPDCSGGTIGFRNPMSGRRAIGASARVRGRYEALLGYGRRWPQ